MIAPIDIGSLPGPAQKLLDPSAPPKLQELAARGVAPGLKPADVLAVVVLLAQRERAEVATTARSTLDAPPPPLLAGALASDLHPAVIDALARASGGKLDVLEKLVTMPRVNLETVEHLARTGTELVTELVATNEARLLAHPRLIELLYMNRATRMSTADRIVDLARRNGLELSGIPAFREAAAALEGELVPEASDEPTPDDVLFAETAALADTLASPAPEDTHEAGDEGTEAVKPKFKPLYKLIADMSISQKVRRAQLGSKEERLLLVRDRNRLVASAVARSPMLQEDDVNLITKNRNVSEEVLRILGSNAEWLKSYTIKRNLVENPKTPLTMSTRLIPLLRDADVRQLAKSKNVTQAIQEAARRHLDRKKQ
ncbi:hypothetical protein [Polyangium sp. 15x6]|uniref:hypothetical protein n=1 Tax=Polyangium sp. 15x6 TaxID=3042687 RepID=UPI00249C6307|nr:hypothetical protein [Polyangium sp. 15x6]MDI3287546.1 hypothetical protein [Polyangium sp. 15x6]